MSPDPSLRVGIVPWRVLSTSHVFDSPWLRVRADRCKTAKGGIVEEYLVVESNDWVCAIAVTDDEQLVLVRQYRHGEAAITLELPAGIMDDGESAIGAARRELLEETGYRGGEARLVQVTSPNPARYANRMHVVLIEGVVAGERGQNDVHEETEAVLWPMTDARALFLKSEFSNSSQAGGLAAALILSERL